MATKETGGPAFPTIAVGPAGDLYGDHGMSLRDWFAGQALVGLIAKSEAMSNGGNKVTDTPVGHVISHEAVLETIESKARGAYLYADAMLAERAKP